jgi:DnaJ-class molecular chaperone
MSNNFNNVLGMGDSGTWGPVRSASDPRYTETDPMPCPKCEGTGWFYVDDDFDKHVANCGTCEGTGWVAYDNINPNVPFSVEV